MKPTYMCKHRYKYFGMSAYISFGVRIYEYNFVCSACGKQLKISALDLESEILEEDFKIKKLMAMGESLDDFNDDAEISVCVYDNIIKTHTGKHVDSIRRKYLKNGIDLNEISRNRQRKQRSF